MRQRSIRIEHTMLEITGIQNDSVAMTYSRIHTFAHAHSKVDIPFIHGRLHIYDSNNKISNGIKQTKRAQLMKRQRIQSNIANNGIN